MAQKMTGALVFDERTDRYDIRFDLASYYGGLHCGDCFDVFTRGKWKPTRIEMNMAQEWALRRSRAAHTATTILSLTTACRRRGFPWKRRIMSLSIPPSFVAFPPVRDILLPGARRFHQRHRTAQYMAFL